MSSIELKCCRISDVFATADLIVRYLAQAVDAVWEALRTSAAGGSELDHRKCLMIFWFMSGIKKYVRPHLSTLSARLVSPRHPFPTYWRKTQMCSTVGSRPDARPGAVHRMRVGVPPGVPPPVLAHYPCVMCPSEF